MLTDKEKSIVLNLAQAFEQLPDAKKEFLLGYAEGVAAMAIKNQKLESEQNEAG